MFRGSFCVGCVWSVLSLTTATVAIKAVENPLLPLVHDVEWQPLAASVRRLMEATDSLGSPLSDADGRDLRRVLQSADGSEAVERVQEILDKYGLFAVSINPESRVKVAQGPVKPELLEQGWRIFLVKVQNDAGVTAALQAVSPNGQSLFESDWSKQLSDKYYKHAGGLGKMEARDLWLDLAMVQGQPLRKDLSGLKLEYRLIQLYSRDAGTREAKILFNVGQGTQDLGFRNEVDVVFHCLPAREITLHVRDEHDQPTTAAFVIRDPQGRVYPSQAKRLAPDFAFHPQIYRADGETLRLPDDTFTVEFSRGPESIASRTCVLFGPFNLGD